MPPTEGLTDGKAAIPLYQQVIDIIKNEINSGAYKAGERIPNEFELAESYKVGRVTVRRAIEELVQQGYLTKRQGKARLSMPPSLSARFARRMTSRVFRTHAALTEWNRGRASFRERYCRRIPPKRSSLVFPLELI